MRWTLADDARRIDDPQLRPAVERLEESIQVLREEQVAMNARLDTLTLRMDRLSYAIIGGTIAVTASVLIHGFIGG